MIIPVLEIEPKLKETMVNDLKSRCHQVIERFACENSESPKQQARILWASPIFYFNVPRYECYTPPIFL